MKLASAGSFMLSSLFWGKRNNCYLYMYIVILEHHALRHVNGLADNKELHIIKHIFVLNKYFTFNLYSVHVFHSILNTHALTFITCLGTWQTVSSSFSRCVCNFLGLLKAFIHFITVQDLWLVKGRLWNVSIFNIIKLISIQC